MAHVRFGESINLVTSVTETKANMTARTAIDVYGETPSTTRTNKPARSDGARVIDWQLAIWASLGLWALIIGIGFAIFS